VTGAGPSDPRRPQTAHTPRTNRKAVFSIVYGVCAFAVIYLFPLGGLVLGVPSITSGVHARREIAASHGEQTGDSIAVYGLMIGGGAIVTVVLSFVVPLL
jgi:hypothetical protein